MFLLLRKLNRTRRNKVDSMRGVKWQRIAIPSNSIINFIIIKFIPPMNRN